MSNKLYFTPGPTQLFHSFQDHFKNALKEDIPSISHRSKQFINVLAEAKEALTELLSIPTGYELYFINSANEAWDRIIQNLVVKHSHHFANGSFSQKFYEFAVQHQKDSTISRAEDGGTFKSLDVPDQAELIGITKNETSVGYQFSEEEIQDIRRANPDKLIALDIVSATPSVPVNFENVDTAYFSVQKAFGLPAGLGIWICNERCLEKATLKAKSESLGSYRTIPNLKKFGDKDQTPETPNMLYIYLIGKIALDMITMGKQRIINDTVYKSTLLYQSVESHPLLTPFVSDQTHRSKTTIVAKTDHAERIISSMNSKSMILGSGYGPHKSSHVRIANFPTHSKESIEMLCDLLEKID